MLLVSSNNTILYLHILQQQHWLISIYPTTIFYEYYNSESKLISKLNSDMDQIQCVVGNIELKNTVSFGNTQSPRLSDYADGVDTLQFIIDL